MIAFKQYARYYDLLYKDKNYEAEVEHVLALLSSGTRRCNSILELGCGTGRHAELMAAKGLEVHGIDISQDMISEALARKSKLPKEVNERLCYQQGDARTFRSDRKYEAVLSLFHVMSYQPTSADLLQAFETSADHLEQGGMFLFDCWYGPAVLTNRPETRIKRMEDEAIFVTRLAEPIIYANENLVDVNYEVLIKDKRNGQLEEIKETHRMRYLFLPEVEQMLATVGLSVIYAREWITGEELDFSTWNAVIISSRK